MDKSGNQLFEKQLFLNTEPDPINPRFRPMATSSSLYTSNQMLNRSQGRFRSMQRQFQNLTSKNQTFKQVALTTTQGFFNKKNAGIKESTEIEKLDHWSYLNGAIKNLKNSNSQSSFSQIQSFVRTTTQEKQSMEQQKQKQMLEKQEERWKRMRLDIIPRIDIKCLDKILFNKVEPKKKKWNEEEVKMEKIEPQQQKIMKLSSIHTQQNEINKRIYQDLLLKKVKSTQNLLQSEPTQLRQNIRSVSKQTISSFKALLHNAQTLMNQVNPESIEKELLREKLREDEKLELNEGEFDRGMMTQGSLNDSQEMNLNLDEYEYFKNNFATIITNLSEKFVEDDKQVDQYGIELADYRKSRKKLKKQVEIKMKQIADLKKKYQQQEEHREEELRRLITIFIEKHKSNYAEYYTVRNIEIDDGTNGQSYKKSHEINFELLFEKCLKTQDELDLMEESDRKEFIEIKSIDLTYERDIKSLKNEKQKILQTKNEELSSIQGDFSFYQNKIQSIMKQVEDIKLEKKSLKQLFKKYIHRALIDDEFIRF